MPYSLAENVKFETCFDVKTLIPVYFVKAFMLTFDIIKLIVTKFAFFFSFKIYETEMKCCYGTDAYGEEVVSNYPKPYDISIYLRCWVYSVGRYISTSHPNPKISKKIAICLSEEKMRNAALYPQTTHVPIATLFWLTSGLKIFFPLYHRLEYRNR